MSDEDHPWREPDPTLESWSGEISADTPWFAFPIGQVEFNPNGTIAVDRSFGTCFFISGEIFITAWHVVEEAVRLGNSIHVLLLRENDEPSGVSFERVKRVAQVLGPDGCGTDIAMGFIGTLPVEKRVPRMPLSSRLVAPGAYVASYGYARNQWHEIENEDGPPDLALNLVPRFCRGTIEEHLPRGRGLSHWPTYVHDAETGGGISGGPLIDVTDGTVCGINSTGMDNAGYSTAADIRVALDWAIPFAGQRTLRSLASEGFIDLR